ncbi:uncharacterized protein TNCV_2001291 [Trichonephila clavipes]|nr:uncharacterized protein TNCV_2001291 [Trichonephila clavipes]
MMEARWSARRITCQLFRFDCVLRRCWDQWTKTRLRMPSIDQSSRRPPHYIKCTRTTNCFITHHPDTGSTFISGLCVFSNHTKEPG